MTENTEGVAAPTPLDRVDGPDHRAALTVEVDTTLTQTTVSTPKTQIAHYAKAIVGGLVSGGTYLMTVLTPAATAGDVTLLQWIGFGVSTLGTFSAVAWATNGPKPVK